MKRYHYQSNPPTNQVSWQSRAQGPIIDSAKVLKRLKVTKQSLNRVLKDLIKLEIIIFKKNEQDTRVKHIFLNEKGRKIFNEIFNIQKIRIYNALLNSKSEEVINFEPHLALFPKKGTKDCYGKIISNIKLTNNKNCYVFFEIDYRKSENITKILENNGFNVIGVENDLSNRPRCIVAHKKK